jgi:hypothetical protein
MTCDKCVCGSVAICQLCLPKAAVNVRDSFRSLVRNYSQSGGVYIAIVGYASCH